MELEEIYEKKKESYKLRKGVPKYTYIQTIDYE